ncbi:MAG TPA: hypothetical protein VLS93_07095, partial [Anaeromyxobacteraceae bacterium]|nr:hypothetical protein [Anaeromyxobacteraceae bacterium]
MAANPTTTSAPEPAPAQPSGVSLLWRTEDWLAVWVAFLLIALVLAGLPVKIPKFKWTTEGAFAAQVTRAVDSGAIATLEASAAQAGEKALQADLGALGAAAAAMDRKA